MASSGPKIVAEVDHALQSTELQSCITETTEHYKKEIGDSNNRMPFSASQIYQLCLATSGQDIYNNDVSSLTTTSRPPRFVTSPSPSTPPSSVQPSTVTLSSLMPDTTVSQKTQNIVAIKSQPSIATPPTTPVQYHILLPYLLPVTVAPTRLSTVSTTRVVYGPERAPTMSPAEHKKKNRDLENDMDRLTRLMIILAPFTG